MKSLDVMSSMKANWNKYDLVSQLVNYQLKDN